MSLPSTDALTIGYFFNAATAALTKNDIKPSLTPCSFSNLSLYLLRNSITGAMLTSLNVVKIALVDCDWTRRSAIRARKRLIGTRSSGRLPRLARLATAGAATCCRAGLAGAAGAAKGAGAAGLTPPAMAPITSPLVTRPSLPVPATSVADIEFSASILAAAGMAMSPLPAGDAVPAVGTGAFGVSTDLTSSGLTWAEASVSIVAMASAGTAVEPAAFIVRAMGPAAGAGSSRTTLS